MAAFMKCVKCGKEYSSTDGSCPHCKLKRKNTFALGFVALAFGLVIATKIIISIDGGTQYTSSDQGPQGLPLAGPRLGFANTKMGSQSSSTDATKSLGRYLTEK